MTARKTAFAVLRQYPQAWRDRYEREVSGLIDDSTLRWRDVAELVRGMLTERARELLSSTEKPKRTLFLLAGVRWAFGTVFLGSVFATAIVFRRSSGLSPEDLSDWVAALVFVVLIGFFVALWKVRDRAASLFGPKPIFPAWAAFAFLPPYFVILTAMAWGTGAGENHVSYLLGWLGYVIPYVNWVYFGVVAVVIAGSVLPGRELLHTLSQAANVERGIASAQQFVDACHEMIAKGVPSPLADAEALLERSLRHRDETHARLHALGYRARFRLGNREPGPLDRNVSA